jgi:hypothetical protein
MAEPDKKEIIGSEDDIFNQMSPEDLLAHINSMALADDQSPEDIVIKVEEERESLKDTFSN